MWIYCTVLGIMKNWAKCHPKAILPWHLGSLGKLKTSSEVSKAFSIDRYKILKFSELLTDSLMPLDRRNSTMERTKGLIFSLLNVALS